MATHTVHSELVTTPTSYSHSHAPISDASLYHPLLILFSLCHRSFFLSPCLPCLALCTACCRLSTMPYLLPGSVLSHLSLTTCFTYLICLVVSFSPVHLVIVLLFSPLLLGHCASFKGCMQRKYNSQVIRIPSYIPAILFNHVVPCLL